MWELFIPEPNDNIQLYQIFKPKLDQMNIYNLNERNIKIDPSPALEKIDSFALVPSGLVIGNANDFKTK